MAARSPTLTFCRWFAVRSTVRRRGAILAVDADPERETGALSLRRLPARRLGCARAGHGRRRGVAVVRARQLGLSRPPPVLATLFERQREGIVTGLNAVVAVDERVFVEVTGPRPTQWEFPDGQACMVVTIRDGRIVRLQATPAAPPPWPPRVCRPSLTENCKHT